MKTFRHSCTWVVLLGSLWGCENLEMGDPGSEEANVGEVEQALMSNVNYNSVCTSEEMTHLDEAHALGAKIARSSALLRCIADAVTDTVALRQYTFGPYMPCSAVDDGDPMQEESVERQLARIASASVSRLDVQINCSNDSCDCGASANDISPGEPVTMTWFSTGGTIRDARLMWHEAMHALGYEHNTSSSNTCEFGPEFPEGNHVASNIMGKCMEETMDAAAASPNCAALAPSCASNEMAVPKWLGAQDVPSAPCECVPAPWVGENEGSDRFGSALAMGDFDGDFYQDLAVGTYAETSHRGVVYLYRGSSHGLRFWKRLSQAQLTGYDYDSGTTPFSVGQNSNDQFGYALAAGDINGDNKAELLVGAPGKSSNAGVVYLIPGSTLGPDLAHVEWIDQTDTGGAVEAGDRFGSSIVVGDFDANSTLDFAIGAPAEVAGGFQGGAVSLHRGRAGVAGSSTFELSDGLFTRNENGAELGYALAAGDIDGDGREELVAGAPGSGSNNGIAEIFEKDSASWSNTQTITRTATRFGYSLAVGDFISDDNDDIAVGSPDDASARGSVFAFRGTASTVAYSQTLAANEAGDRFGEALAIANVGVGKEDLLVGMPGEAFGSGPAEGRVAIYSGTTNTQVNTTPYRFLDQYDFFDGGSSDTVLPPEHHGTDGFGSALLSYRQNVPLVTSRQGVAVGAPKDTVDGANSGSVFVYFGMVADRKLDQVTMRHADSLPYQF
jgi:hypothetical protein